MIKYFEQTTRLEVILEIPTTDNILACAPLVQSIIRPNKVKKKFLVLLPGQFLPSENTQTDRHIITKRHYDRKYVHIHTVMLLNTWKICITEVINYSKIDVET